MALKICSIASGSKGNCIYVGSERTELLLDFGVSCKRVKDAMEGIGASPKAIFLTHTHTDHFRCVPNAIKKGALLKYPLLLKSGINNVEGEPFQGDVYYGDITVSPFPVSHDVPCYGYSFYSEGSKISVVTDLGIMPQSTLDGISDSDVVLIESNYDKEMLRLNPDYSPALKARIDGRRGHLSNDDCAECVAKLVGRGVRNIILGHLSENNNTPEIALARTENELRKYNLSGKAKITVATQHERTEVIEV